MNMQPLVLSTWAFGRQANAAAWEVLKNPGGSALDAVEQACRVVEEDPEVTSVGYGGLPDGIGEVTLDAAVMLSPERCAGVAFVRGFPHPISLARVVMETSGHKLLVGEGAEQIARSFGWRETNLRTPQALNAWRRYLATQASKAAPAAPGAPQTRELPPTQGEDQTREGCETAVSRLQGSENRLPQTPGFPDRAELLLPPLPEVTPVSDRDIHDTIGVLARDHTGQIAAGCSTSGLAFKLHGRVGDSPIVGHGLYVDPAVGGAVATGHGELIMGVCGCFLAVECLRRGSSAQEAATEVIRRIAAAYQHLEGKQAAVIVLSRAGEWAAAALRKGFQVAVRTFDHDLLCEPGFVLFDT
jgi:isoaspartyl peptidase/L-asparaginase-like protein (Ntn-hydrolase superfamily)